METYKLRIKIGQCEFEAEGSQDSVEAQFATFQELIKVAPAGVKVSEVIPTSVISQEPTEPTHSLVLSEIFNIDSTKNILTLRVSPEHAGTKKGKIGTATLLLLYGFRKLLNQEDVFAVRLTDALRDSGVGPLSRIDRAVDPLVSEGMITRTGQKRGTKYRATNKGMAEAEKLARELLAHIS